MDSPKVLPCKEKEGADNQHVPSTPAREAVKEEKSKELERKRKFVPTVLEMYATRPHTRPSNKLRFKFKLMENPKLEDMIINIDEEPLAEKEGKRSANSKKTSTEPKMRVSKVHVMRVSKAEGLKMLAAVLDNLH